MGIKIALGQKEAWKGEYNGHTIIIKNDIPSVTLEIDGKVQSKDGSIINSLLIGKLPEGETVMACLDSGFSKVTAHVIIGADVPMQYGLIKKDDTFTPIENENDVIIN